MTNTHQNAVEEFGDAERAQLIEEIGRTLGIAKFNPAGFFFLWMSDIEQLRAIKILASNPSMKNFIASDFGPSGSKFADVIKAWLKPETNKTTTFDEEEEECFKPKASTVLPDVCFERDRGLCIVTKGADALESCYIYPQALASRRGTSLHQTTFWEILKIFWKPDEVKTWQDTVEGVHGTEHLRNVLCLWSGVHSLWEKALFALKPIRKWQGDRNEEYLTLKFYWMHGVFMDGPISITTRPSLPGDLDSSPMGTRLWDCQREEKIKSGLEITMKTSNKRTHPLPSFELLQMQWSLNMIASLSGIGEALEDDNEE